MSKLEEVYPSGKYKWKGSVDLKVLYKKIYEWLKDEEYVVYEKSYGVRLKPNGKQLEIVWEATKDESPYFLKRISLEFFGIGLNDVEVERDGKNLKLQKGELEVGFKAELVLNASDDWKEGFVHTLYEKYMIDEKIEEEKIELYKDLHDLVAEIKTFLALYHFE